MPPPGVPFIGTSFSLESIEYSPNYTITLKFTQDPLRSDPAGVNDCTNPFNYTLHGPHAASVSRVNTTSDPQVLRITTTVPLEKGGWVLVIADNVTSDTGSALVAPKSLVFDSSLELTVAAELNPRADDGSYDILRKHFSGAFKGAGWDALLMGIAAGDEICRENIFNIFDQLFVSTADGKYLDRRGADRDIARPQLVGMTDDAYRNYIIKSTNGKVTLESIWEMLEVFYGKDSTHGWAKSVGAAPFALQDGDTLTFLVDEEQEVLVTFNAGDFDNIAAATAEEVAAVVTRACNQVSAPAHAVSYLDPDTNTWRVKIYSETLGMKSVIRVLGGRAQNLLQFSTEVEIYTSSVTYPYTLNFNKDTEGHVILYSWDSVAIFDDLRPGDYANMYLASTSALDFNGVMQVTETYSTVVGPWIYRFVVFDTKSDLLVPGAYDQVSESELMFFRPTRNDIYNSSYRTIQAAQHARSNFDIIIPATTEIVNRVEGTGAYGQAGISFTSAASGENQAITFSTSQPVSQGDWVIIDGAECSTSMAGITGDIDPPSSMGIGQIGTSPIVQWQKTTIGYSLPNSIALMVGGNYVEQAFGSSPTYINENVNPDSSLELWDDVNYGSNQVASGAVTPMSSPVPGYGVVCGGSVAGVVSPDIYISGGLITAPMPVEKIYHSCVAKQDGTVVIGCGQDNTAIIRDSVHLLTINVASIVDSTVDLLGNLNMGRWGYGMVELDDGSILFCGGFCDDPSLPYLNTCEILTMGGVATYTGPMNSVRLLGYAIKLESGDVLMIGGYGWRAGGTPAFDNLNDCEIWDHNTGKWRLLSNHPKYSLGACKAVLMDDGNVLTVGQGGYAQILDVNTWKWHVIPGRLCTGTALTSCDLLKTDGVTPTFYCVANTVDDGVPSDSIYWLTGDKLSNGVGAINGLQQVSATVPGSFRVSLEKEGYFNPDSDVTVTLVAAQTGTIAGPYLVDNTGVAICEANSTTTSDIWAGSRHSLLELTSGVDFPEDGGWIVFGFGTAKQTGPVYYSGKRSVNELFIDGTFEFGYDLASGTAVMLLDGKGPWVPPSPLIGLLHITPSSAGRLECANAIINGLAAGIDLTIRISYPNGVGLGNYGQPVNGVTKLSDVVYVWGSDDPDAEIAAARLVLNE